VAEQKPGALPKSPLGAAIGYAMNNWDALKRYLDQGFLALDNNLSERTLRAIALGRNNWGVIGSEVGGQTAAVLYSLTGTCKHLGIDPFAYLRDALPGLFDWLPDRWPLNRSRNQLSPEVTAG
jgi:transposase